MLYVLTIAPSGSIYGINEKGPQIERCWTPHGRTTQLETEVPSAITT